MTETTNCFGHLKLAFRIYLGFGICYLKFPDPAGSIAMLGSEFMQGNP